MGVLDAWFFAELTTKWRGICAKKILEKKRKGKAQKNCDKKPQLRADKNCGAGQELRRCELRSWLIIFPQQNTSADKPDRLNQHHHAEAMHVKSDVA